MTRKIFLLLTVWMCSAANAGPISFGLFADVPYNLREREQLPLLIAEMSADALAFVVHGGDIKKGSEICSDAAYQAILDAFQQSAHPLVYVPGDNEWVDCHHRRNADFEPVERLGKLRTMFWSTESTLGRRTMKLERQSSNPAFAAYRENVRWEAGGVLFASINLPGSENNFWGTSNGSVNQQGPVAEFVERGAANHAWLAEAFALARARKLPGILIVAHANPGFEAWNGGHAPTGYGEFLAQLREETQSFPGKVVLVHGDTHHQHIDQPMQDPNTREVVRNFTRVENFGSPFLGWIKGTVDVNDPDVFRFSPRLWRPRPDPQ
ncbi:MAG: hypothetical protein NTV11_13430 [Rhodocyclales bacterium]|nr:hypothetical protein [Rhodocyclales bacterium]